MTLALSAPAGMENVPREWIWLGAFFTFLIAATAPTGLDMARQWIASSSYHHGLFILPAALWMAMSQPAIASPSDQRRFAWAFVISGVLIWVVGRAATASIIEQIGFITILIGSVGAVFGDSVLRKWAYPLAFLYFMVPFGEAIVPLLQTITAKLVIGLLTVFGFSPVAEELFIKVDARTFAIAEACAGLRFLISTFAVSAVFGFFAFSAWRRRLTFLSFALGFAVLANAMRAFLLIAVISLSDGKIAIGADHFIIGWLFYAGVLILIALIGRQFAKSEVKSIAPPITLHRSTTSGVASLIGAAGFVIAAAFFAQIVVERPTHITSLSETYLSAEGWRILPAAQNWRPSTPGADHITGAAYSSEKGQVYVWSAAFSHDRRGSEIGSSLHRAANGVDWRTVGGGEGVVYLFATSQEQRFQLLAGPEHRRLAVLRAYWVGDEVFFDPQAVKRKQIIQKLRAKNNSGGVIFFAASYYKDPQEAISVIREFTASLEPLENWRRRMEIN